MQCLKCSYSRYHHLHKLCNVWNVRIRDITTCINYVDACGSGEHVHMHKVGGYIIHVVHVPKS